MTRQEIYPTKNSITKPLLYSALILANILISSAQQASANYCDGRKFGMLVMPTSERIYDAREATGTELKRLREIGNNQLYDKKHIIEGIKDETRDRNLKLADDTIQLCQISQQQGYAPIEYNGIRLNDEGEINAQIRINLSKLQAGEIVLSASDEKSKQAENNLERIVQKANELEVLKKQLEALDDPRKTDRDQYYEDTISSACVAIDSSEKLRLAYAPTSREVLFAEAADKSKTRTISNELLETFKANCSLNQQWAVGTTPLNK